MSRWIEKFSSHPFRKNWEAIKSSLAQAKVDDETVLTSVAELGRLKKLTSYLDGLLKSIDPELTPMSTWDSFDSQAVACLNQINDFNSDKNISHIQQANEHADNLLTYVRPYMVATGRIAKSLRDAAASYSSTLLEQATAFREKSNSLLAEVQNNKQASDEIAQHILVTKTSIDSTRDELLGPPENGENKGKIVDLNEKIGEFVKKYGEILDLYNKIIVGIDGKESISASIQGFVRNAEGESEKAKSTVQRATVLVNDLTAFHSKIFGAVDDDGKRAGGLEFDLGQLKTELDEFNEQQKLRYSALNTQIESLLPGATSAGLASAYNDMKKSFGTPVRNANLVFYGAITLLVATSLTFAIDRVWLWGIDFEAIGDWESVARSITYKLPFYGPIIWLAYYASKRRSEFQRLQQEYAHKEALAKSYDSYKQQIDALGSPDKEMLRSLIERAIEAISYNASITLDGTHGDKMPLHGVIEKLLDKIPDAAKD